jgi:hypothetical protein
MIGIFEKIKPLILVPSLALFDILTLNKKAKWIEKENLE